MTDTNDRLRALFLAALMVLSVFAGTIALTGSAAAEDHTLAESGADQPLDSGSTFWQGQELWLQGLAGDDTYQIRRVNDDGEVGGLETEFTTTGNGTATVDTSNLDGFYVIVNTSTDDVVQFDGTGSGSDYTGGAEEADNVSASDWEVAPQSLSVEFDEDDLPASTGDKPTINVDSNRGSFAVNVTAEGLDEDELGEIFNTSENEFVNTSDADEDDDDSVQINTSSNGEIVANFSAFDQAGSYTFDFEVSDTTASASASIDVQEQDVGLSFSQSVYAQEEGDFTAITVQYEDTDTAYLYIGGENVNYLERVELVDDDGDGTATVIFNTYLAGAASGNNNSQNIGGDADADAFTLPDDSDDEIDSVTRYNDTDFPGETIDITSSSIQPIEPGDYDMTLSSSADPPAADNNALTITDEEDVATLDLTERSTDSISTMVAPIGAADIDPDDPEEVQDLLNSSTESSTVAINDRLIVQVEASGIYGYVSDDEGNGLDTVYGDKSPPYGAYLNITPTGGTNQGSSMLSLTGDEAQLITPEDPSSNTMYLVVDTRNLGLEDGDQYEASFQVGHEDMTGSVNPYVAAGEEERVETEFTFEDMEAEFDNVDDSTLQVQRGSNATVSGTTNAAPGDEVTVRLRKTGESPFLMTETVEIGSDGSFSAEFDTSEIPLDTEFTAIVRQGSDDISDELDAVIVEQITTAPPTTEAPTTEAPTTEEPTTEAPTTETTTEEPMTTTESDGQPGFGVAIAIVALLGAALLALRRRD